MGMTENSKWVIGALVCVSVVLLVLLADYIRTKLVVKKLEIERADYRDLSVASARELEEKKQSINALLENIVTLSNPTMDKMLECSEVLWGSNLPEDARKNTAILIEQIQKLQLLTDSFVKVGGLENVLFTVHPTQGQVQTVLEEIHKTYQPIAQEKGLYFLMDTSECSAYFDEAWTAVAIGRLVDSALRFTSRGGVTLAVKEEGDFARIDVTDTGIGITTEEQGRILTGFPKNTEKDNRDLIGAGAYLAHQIISLEGGTIEVTSTPNEGSRFSVFLPKEKSADGK